MRALFIFVLLLLLVAPALAEPPTWWADTARYLYDHKMTEVNTTCWMDSTGGYHAALLNTTTYRATLFGFEYGDLLEHYTYSLDGVVVVDGTADLTERHIACEPSTTQASIDSLGQYLSYWPILIVIVVVGVLGMIGITFRSKDDDDDEEGK